MNLSVSTQLCLMSIHFYAFYNAIIDVLVTLNYKHIVTYNYTKW